MGALGLATVLGKDHFIVMQPQLSDHAMVEASSTACNPCFFNDATNSKNPSGNKFCMLMSGYMRVGQEC